ncbi:hypothetical protein RCL1_006767 [Eukaryota sp. TZLM3-RCL]
MDNKLSSQILESIIRERRICEKHPHGLKFQRQARTPSPPLSPLTPIDRKDLCQGTAKYLKTRTQTLDPQERFGPRPLTQNSTYGFGLKQNNTFVKSPPSPFARKQVVQKSFFSNSSISIL